jgi:hypothetical protein
LMRRTKHNYCVASESGRSRTLLCLLLNLCKQLSNRAKFVSGRSVKHLP